MAKSMYDILMVNPFNSDRMKPYVRFQRDLENNVHLMSGQSATVIKFLHKKNLLNIKVIEKLYAD